MAESLVLLSLSSFLKPKPFCSKSFYSSIGFSTRYPRRQRFIVSATEDPKEQTEDEDEDPVWIRREKMRELEKTEDSGKFELPFYVSLPLSAVVAIAAVGSVFEFLNRKPVFGVIQPDSPFWLPVLAFFALTGLPVSGYFFFSSVEAANKLAERMDKIDNA